MYLSNTVLDGGLEELQTATELRICTALPADRAAAISTSLATVSTPPVNAPDNHPSGGRRVTIDSISGGNVTVTGTATHWALINGTELLAAAELITPRDVGAGSTLTLGAVAIRFPGLA